MYHWKQEWILYHSYRVSNFNLTMSPLYQIKLKITQKQPTVYCSAFCRTYCSKFSQKVVQCSFLPLFVRKFLWWSSDRKYFTFSWVFIKSLSSNSMWLILTSKVKFNCRDLWRITIRTSPCKLVSKYITGGKVFIPVSIGAENIKIDHEIRELYSKINWHLFLDTVYILK